MDEHTDQTDDQTDLGDWGESQYPGGDDGAGGGADDDTVNLGAFQASLDWDVHLDEADLPLAKSFADSMSEKGLDRDAVQEALRWYSHFSERHELDRADADERAVDAVEATMREEWGDEFNARLDNVKVLNEIATEVDFDLEGARLPNGTRLLDSPEFLRWANVIAELIAFDDFGDDDDGSAASEKARIEAMMGDRSSAYWRGPDAERLQRRYRELLGG